MKVRSKKMWQYIIDSGALQGGTKEDIEKCKIAWRKEYKRKWKQNKIIKPIELRPGFSAKQYKELQIRAKEFGTTPTGYVKQITLASVGIGQAIPGKQKLITVLQLVSIASIAVSKAKHGKIEDPHRISNHLEQAEKLLLEYLKD